MTNTAHRRDTRSMLAAPAVAALLALAGCGSADGTEAAQPDDAEESPGGTPSESLLPEPEGSTEYPLTLTTWAGESVLEERPERIAVIGFSTNVDFVQALEVTPVYTLTEDAEYPWRDEEWFAQIEHVDSATRRDPLNFEALAAADPDLIIVLNFLADGSDYERLTEVAPVLDYASAEQLGDQADWRAGQRLVGEALDLAEAAETAIDEADEEIAAVAAAHPEFEGRTITIGSEYGAEYGFEYYTTTGGTAEGIMGDLGFAPNPLAENFVEDPVISDENLSLLDSEVLLVMYADQATREARETMPLFESLPPVAEGRYVSLTTSEDDPMRLVRPDGTETDNATWVLRRGASTVSLPWAVDVIANEWLAGIDLS